MDIMDTDIQMDNFNLFSDVDFSDLLFDSEELDYQCHEELLNDLGFTADENCFLDANLCGGDVPFLFDEIAESYPDDDSSMNQVDCILSPEDGPIDVEVPIDVEELPTPLKEPKIIVSLKKNQPTKRKIIVKSMAKKQEINTDVIKGGAHLKFSASSFEFKRENVIGRSLQAKSLELPHKITANGLKIVANNFKNSTLRKIQIVHPPISRQATKVRILIGGKKNEGPRQKSCLLSSPSYLPPSPPNSDIELSPWRSIITDISSPAMLAGGLLRLSEEEKRTLISEGYPIPTRLPLTKQEERALKRVQRKIKNKMSAQESRRKKKDYLESLEKRLDYTNEENGRLKQKLVSLENNNRTLLGQLKHMQELLSNCSKSTKTILMNLIVFFAVFAGVLNIDFTSIKSQETAAASSNDYTATTKPSRVLLSINEDTESPNHKSDWSFLWTCKEGAHSTKEVKNLYHDHDYYYNVDDYIGTYGTLDCEGEDGNGGNPLQPKDGFVNKSIYGDMIGEEEYSSEDGGGLVENNQPMLDPKDGSLNDSSNFSDWLDIGCDSGRCGAVYSEQLLSLKDEFSNASSFIQLDNEGDLETKKKKVPTVTLR